MRRPNDAFRAQHSPQYVPWSFCDMIRLADRLPDFTEGVNRSQPWKTTQQEYLWPCGTSKHYSCIHSNWQTHHWGNLPYSKITVGETADHVGFNGHHNKVSTELRKHIQRKWTNLNQRGKHKFKVSKQVPAYVPEKMERGDRIACNTNNTTQRLFKVRTCHWKYTSA